MGSCLRFPSSLHPRPHPDARHVTQGISPAWGSKSGLSRVLHPRAASAQFSRLSRFHVPCTFRLGPRPLFLSYALGSFQPCFRLPRSPGPPQPRRSIARPRIDPRPDSHLCEGARGVRYPLNHLSLPTARKPMLFDSSRCTRDKGSRLSLNPVRTPSKAAA